MRESLDKIKIASLILSLGLLAALFFPRFNSEILFPDSSSYIGHDAVRGMVYPYFLDLVGPKHAEGKVLKSEDYHQVSWVQWALVLLTAFFCFKVLMRESKFLWAPVAFVGLFVLHKFIFFNAAMVGNVTSHTAYILTEGLVPAWVFLTTTLLLLYFSKKSLWSAVCLGFVVFLGVELTARFLFISILVFFPLIFALIERKNWKQAFAPILTFLFFFLAKCTATYINYGVFNNVPFDGISLMGPAVQFSSEEDISRFTDETERKYVEAIVRDPRRREPILYSKAPQEVPPWNEPFVIRNIYVIALGNYKTLIGQSEVGKMNLFLSKVSKKILWGNPHNVKRWFKWLGDNLVFLYAENAFFTLTHLLLFLWLTYKCLYKQSLSALLWTGYAILCAHLFHTIAVVFVSYPDRRFLTSTEMFIPFVLLFIAIDCKKTYP